MWGAVFLVICTVLNLAHVNVFKLVITLGVYAEMVGSVGVALLLFLFFSAACIFRIVSASGHGNRTQPDGGFSGGDRHCGLGLHWF
jgi:hypothetical protein